MSRRDARLLLEDMKEACDRIMQYTSGMDYDHFLNDIKTTDAVIRNIQILGEAANQLTPDARQQYAEIEWKKIIRSRHILVHEYFELDYEIIWRIVTAYIPPLHAQLINLLKR